MHHVILHIIWGEDPSRGTCREHGATLVFSLQAVALAKISVIPRAIFRLLVNWTNGSSGETEAELM